MLLPAAAFAVHQAAFHAGVRLACPRASSRRRDTRYMNSAHLAPWLGAPALGLGAVSSFLDPRRRRGLREARSEAGAGAFVGQWLLASAILVAIYVACRSCSRSFFAPPGHPGGFAGVIGARRLVGAPPRACRDRRRRVALLLRLAHCGARLRLPSASVPAPAFLAWRRFCAGPSGRRARAARAARIRRRARAPPAA